MDMCSRVLEESTTNKFDGYNRQEQCIDHIPCYLSGLSRAHFSDNLSVAVCITYIVEMAQNVGNVSTKVPKD